VRGFLGVTIRTPEPPRRDPRVKINHVVKERPWGVFKVSYPNVQPLWGFELGK